LFFLIVIENGQILSYKVELPEAAYVRMKCAVYGMFRSFNRTNCASPGLNVHFSLRVDLFSCAVNE